MLVPLFPWFMEFYPRSREGGNLREGPVCRV